MASRGPETPLYCRQILSVWTCVVGQFFFSIQSNSPRGLGSPQRTRIFDSVQFSGFHGRKLRPKEIEQVVQDDVAHELGAGKTLEPFLPEPITMHSAPPDASCLAQLASDGDKASLRRREWDSQLLGTCGWELGPEQHKTFSSPGLQPCLYSPSILQCGKPGSADPGLRAIPSQS